MLPLSFANVMGGVTSIIGTSPNLLVASLAEKKDPNINIGFFEVGKVFFDFFSFFFSFHSFKYINLGIVGLPICIIGIAYMTIACYWLLPDRLNVGDTIIKNAREYTLCIEVKKVFFFLSFFSLFKKKKKQINSHRVHQVLEKHLMKQVFAILKVHFYIESKEKRISFLFLLQQQRFVLVIFFILLEL